MILDYWLYFTYGIVVYFLICQFTKRKTLVSKIVRVFLGMLFKVYPLMLLGFVGYDFVDVIIPDETNYNVIEMVSNHIGRLLMSDWPIICSFLVTQFLVIESTNWQEKNILIEGFVIYDMPNDTYYVYTRDGAKFELRDGSIWFVETDKGSVKTVYNKGKFKGVDELIGLHVEQKV